MGFFYDFLSLTIGDEISVFWVDYTMYIEDEEENKVIMNDVSLYEACKFSKLIKGVFDYEATDKEIVKFYNDLSFDYDDSVNVFDYLEDIKDDYRKITGNIISMDEIRQIVSWMSDLTEDNSDTYIANILWKGIKGDENSIVGNCSEQIANKLADKYLQFGEYDLIGFAKELHEIVQKNTIITIEGSLWVNSAKYEYVDKIKITDEEVEIYNKNVMIGCILRKNINTLVEQNYKDDIMTDLIDNMSYIIDIKKEGDSE